MELEYKVNLLLQRMGEMTVHHENTLADLRIQLLTVNKENEALREQVTSLETALTELAPAEDVAPPTQ